ncbi:MAG TPA: N-acetylglucosamine-6-phosphate deacetylase [Planctomycetota bacterium]|nr:N-acetylglucosamine-6-phosphate deacetylase [Planctomycetota bacterium]
MSETLLARRFDTAQPVRLTLSGASLTKIEPADSAPDNVWLAPALFDPQVNGYAGVDFQQDVLTEDVLLKAARGLHAAGCGQFFFTLCTDEIPKLTARLNHARALRAKSKELQSAIAGWHVEGPFLSPEPGYHGAHDPAKMLDPAPDRIRALRAAAGDDPLLLTLAPERAGAIDAIALAVSLNIRISLGHTDASSEILAAAVKAGASGFTHLGNACPQKIDRHNNILLRAIETPSLHFSIIPDTIHVSPPMFRLFHAGIASQSTGTPPPICYTTDAMSAAGEGPGRYRIGKIETEVGADKIVRMPGQTNFAGSALRPIDGVFLAARMLNCSWRETWARASVGTRKYAGLPTKQQTNAAFCVLTVDESNFRTGQIFANGEKFEITRG